MWKKQYWHLPPPAVQKGHNSLHIHSVLHFIDLPHECASNLHSLNHYFSFLGSNPWPVGCTRCSTNLAALVFVKKSMFLCLFLFAALFCNCTTPSCEKYGYKCETNGACVVSTSVIGGQEQNVRLCIQKEKLVPPGQPFYCLSAEGLMNTHCCYKDYCNSIDLKLPTSEHHSIIT